MASSRQQLVELLQQGVISPEHVADAEQLANVAPNKEQWQQFVNTVLLWIACISLSCAIVFFFAYNWSQMGRFLKFALVEFALISTTLIYLKTPANNLVRVATLTLSCLLVGALMALFGQTYQTGADPWQLFFNWALIITPWALVARNSIIWLLWFVLLNITLVLYCDVHRNPFFIMFYTKVSTLWLIFAFNLASFSVWQFFSASHPWMQKTWLMRMLATLAGVSITGLAIEAVYKLDVINLLALVLWLISLVSMYYCYRIKKVDLFMLAGGCLSIIAVFIVWMEKQLGSFDNILNYIILAFFVLGLGIASAIWLKKVQREIKHEC